MKKTILIVEDEVALVKVLEDKLVRADLKVIRALDGKEGLQLAKEHKPDLILLDIIMPKMDGFTMLKELKKTDWGKEIPVIFLTNLSDSGKASEIVTQTQETMRDYLIKSDWTLEDVVDRVKERLQTK